MLKLVVLLAVAATCVYAENAAVVVLVGMKNNVEGTLKFTQVNDKDVKIEGEIKGLTPGKHGFHIHEKGDLSDGCTSTGIHFNPNKKNHGAPTAAERHVGDLGNVEADANGVAKVEITDSQIALSGSNCIVGRAVVVHEKEDDLGQGGNKDSLTTGNAGGRLACGIIGVASEDFDFGKNASQHLSATWSLVALALIGWLFAAKFS